HGAAWRRRSRWTSSLFSLAGGSARGDLFPEAIPRWDVQQDDLSTPVMRGLDPRIHLLRKTFLRRWMDCRVKPGNDGFAGGASQGKQKQVRFAELQFTPPPRYRSGDPNGRGADNDCLRQLRPHARDQGRAGEGRGLW